MKEEIDIWNPIPKVLDHEALAEKLRNKHSETSALIEQTCSAIFMSLEKTLDAIGRCHQDQFQQLSNALANGVDQLQLLEKEQEQTRQNLCLFLNTIENAFKSLI